MLPGISLNQNLGRLMEHSELDNNFLVLSNAIEALQAELVSKTAANTWTGAQTFQKSILENVVSLGASNTIDVSGGAVFKKTISGATTLSVTNAPIAGVFTSFILELTNGGSAAVTWWPNIKWPGGLAPSLTAAGMDRIGFYTTNGGATWEAARLAPDSK